MANRPVFTAKIAVNKILKDYLFKGKKDTYLDIAIWENRDGPSEYDDTHFITQSVNKAAREAGVKGPIIGNMRPMEGDKPAAPPAQKPKPPHDPDLDVSGDDIVF